MKLDLSSTFIVSTASGKGGVGKSLATVNTAEQLNEMGYKVAIIDADLGLSNCAMLLNEQVPASAIDVLNENCYVEDTLLTTASGITLVTGADEPNARIPDWSMAYPILDEIIRKLRQEHDFILIDTPAGASDLSLWALDRSDLCITLLVDEPTVISDVYRFCKFVLEIDPSYPFAAVVNFAEDERAAKDVLNRFNTILKHFLNRELPFIGFLPVSEEIRQSVSNQQPVAIAHPDSPVAKEFSYIAQTLLGMSKNNLSPFGDKSSAILSAN